MDSLSLQRFSLLVLLLLALVSCSDESDQYYIVEAPASASDTSTPAPEDNIDTTIESEPIPEALQGLSLPAFDFVYSNRDLLTETRDYREDRRDSYFSYNIHDTSGNERYKVTYKNSDFDQGNICEFNEALPNPVIDQLQNTIAAANYYSRRPMESFKQGLMENLPSANTFSSCFYSSLPYIGPISSPGINPNAPVSNAIIDSLGEDGLAGTDDDIYKFIIRYRYNGQGKLSSLLIYEDPGNDSVWNTSDDVATQAISYIYSGKFIHQAIAHKTPGPDKQWFTPDDQKDPVATLDWDSQGRLVSTSGLLIEDTTFRYSGGNLVFSEGEYEYANLEYNSDNQLEKETIYNKGNDRITNTSDDYTRNIFTYDYDNSDRLESISTGNNDRVSSTSTYQYDSQGRLTGLKHHLADLDYNYNDSGKLTSIITLNADDLLGIEYTYTDWSYYNILETPFLQPGTAYTIPPEFTFTDNFTTTNHIDTATSNAAWDSMESHWTLGIKSNADTGQFTQFRDLGLEQDNTEATAIGDIDNDGDIDLVVANRGQPNRIYFNDGNGEFGDTGKNAGNDTDQTLDVSLADLDNDGDLDIIAGNKSGTNKVYYNNNGNFDLPAVPLDEGSTNTTSISTGDVDLDGDIDIIAGNSGTHHTLYLNKGNGEFEQAINIGNGESDTRSILLSDIDQDGDPDLLEGNYSSNNRLYINQGNAFLGAPGTTIGTESDRTLSITAGDINGDGFTDIITGNDAQPNRFYLNTSSHDFSAAGHNITNDTDYTRAIHICDHDNDGDADIFVANDSQASKVYLNNNGLFTNGMSISNSQAIIARSISSADLDQDGDIDVVIGVSSGRNKHFITRGYGVYSGKGQEVDTDSDSSRDSSLGDIDGDGDLDLVIANRGGLNKLYLNNGNGQFSSTGIAIGNSGYDTFFIRLADFDLDNDLDVLTGSAGSPNELYFNDGSGSFAPAQPVGEQNSYGPLVVDDVDADGDIDFLTGDDTNSGKLYLNDGAGNFSSPAISIGSGVINSLSGTFGDFDSDGDLDLVTGNFGDQRDLIFFNNGSEVFTDGSPIGLQFDYTSSIQASDLDMDGDLDIVAAAYPLKVYLNKGNGVFNNPVEIDSGPDYRPLWLSLLDINNDGYEDIVATDRNHSLRYYLNDGLASFTPLGQPLNRENQSLSYNSSFGDVDSDGDIDAIVPRYDLPNILFLKQAYIIHHNRVVSTTINQGETIRSLILKTDTTHNTSYNRNTSIEFLVSNNGGNSWYPVKPNQYFSFPSSGADLRWMARLHSLSAASSPALESITLSVNPPDVLAGETDIYIPESSNNSSNTTTAQDSTPEQFIIKDTSSSGSSGLFSLLLVLLTGTGRRFRQQQLKAN